MKQYETIFLCFVVVWLTSAIANKFCNISLLKIILWKKKQGDHLFFRGNRTIFTQYKKECLCQKFKKITKNVYLWQVSLVKSLLLHHLKISFSFYFGGISIHRYKYYYKCRSICVFWCHATLGKWYLTVDAQH